MHSNNYSFVEAGNYKEALDICKQRLSIYQELQDYTPYISIVPLQKHVSHYGEAASCGIVGISPKILQKITTTESLVENI